jgi:hypothetical protein
MHANRRPSVTNAMNQSFLDQMTLTTRQFHPRKDVNVLEGSGQLHVHRGDHWS